MMAELSDIAKKLVRAPEEDMQFTLLKQICSDEDVKTQIKEAIRKMVLEKGSDSSNLNFYITLSYQDGDPKKGVYVKGNYKTCKVAVKWNPDKDNLEPEPYMVTIQSHMTEEDLSKVKEGSTVSRFIGMKSLRIGRGSVSIRVRALAPTGRVTVNATRSNKTSGMRRLKLSLERTSEHKLIAASKMGTTLTAILRDPSISIREKAWIVQAVIKKLQEFHEDGKSHGDVKPDNILVMPDGTVKFIDLPDTEVLPGDPWPRPTDGRPCSSLFAPWAGWGCCAVLPSIAEYDKMPYKPLAGEMDQYALLRSIQYEDVSCCNGGIFGSLLSNGSSDLPANSEGSGASHSQNIMEVMMRAREACTHIRSARIPMQDWPDAQMVKKFKRIYLENCGWQSWQRGKVRSLNCSSEVCRFLETRHESSTCSFSKLFRKSSDKRASIIAAYGCGIDRW